ncbi:MAG TPA: two-component regulator propeller domain-containing protein [Kofleriaceae bacterium]|nr:two-component regulator propeller domain-containing protein [Kofleriaceae bacterium]
MKRAIRASITGALVLAVIPAVVEASSASRRRSDARQSRGRSAEQIGSPPALAATRRTIRMDQTIRFHRLGLSEGLPQFHVTSIAQDRVGFMWFGTEEGLARYDGAAFVVYRHQTDGQGPLPSSSVTALAMDHKGKLWIGTAAGLVSYDPTTDSFAPLAPRPATVDPTARPGRDPFEVVGSLLVDQGALWVGYGDGSLDRIDVATRAVTSLGKPAGSKASAPISALARDHEHSLWVGTQGDGLFRIDPSGKVTGHYGAEAGAASLSSDTINALLVTADGALWVGTEEAGLALMAPEGGFDRITGGDGARQLTDSRVTLLLEDSRGSLWVGTKNGLNRVDPVSRLVDQILASQPLDPGALSFGWLTSGAIGRDGVIWIGTFANGLNSFDSLATRFHFIDPNLPATSFCEDRDEVLWIGTYPGTLIRFDRRARKADVYSHLVTYDGRDIDLMPTRINRIHVARDGTVWMLVGGTGLVSFDPTTELARVYSDAETELGASGGWGLAAAEDGVLWLATWGGGLVKFDPRDKSFVRYSAADGLSGIPTDQLYTVAIDRRDPSILWLGTAKSGLVRFDSKTETSRIYRNVPSRPDSLSHDDVLSIYQAADGILWIGTYGGGLNRFDDRTGRFERFAENVGISSGTIYGVAGDDQGVLWMSTNGAGLVRFDPATRRAIAFDARDGVPNEYGQGSPYRGPSGRLYFSGPPGFAYWFLPEEIQLDTAPPKVVLTSFQVNNRTPVLARPVWLGPDIGLRHDETLLAFRFSGLGYTSPQKIRYQYRIDGFSDDWVDAPASLVTVSLPSGRGDYALRVRAASRHGRWGAPVELASLAVSPAPWRTWWAYAMDVAGGLLIVFGFIRLHGRRVARLHQANRLAKVERDLELTGAVQSGFLPRDNLIVSNGLEVRGFYRPAGTCSGDWWWYELTEDGRHRLLIGDVTGHGPGPAMVTAAVASAYRAQTELVSALPLERRLEAVNREVLRVGQGTYQMSLTAIEIDVAGGELRAFSAGGLPAVVLSDGPAEVVVCRGTPLGTPAFQLGKASRRLQPGSRIFLCTDGVIEIELANGRSFGLRRLIKLLESTYRSDLTETTIALSQEASAANGRAIQKDDWTFAIADWERRAS